jgi:hypothetical protein
LFLFSFVWYNLVCHAWDIFMFTLYGNLHVDVKCVCTWIINLCVALNQNLVYWFVKVCVALVARFILGLGLIPTHAYHLTIVVYHVHIMNVTFLCMCFLFYASSNFYGYCYLFCKCEISIKMFSSCSNSLHIPSFFGEVWIVFHGVL